MSSDSHSSPDWYRVADTKPCLRSDVRIIRHIYLGRPWFVIANRTGTKVHRLTAAAHAFVGRLNGRITVEALSEDLSKSLGADAPAQGDIVQLLSQLHRADLLDMTDTPLLEELLERRDKERGQFWKKIFLNPLSATIPLFDPTRLLSGILAVLRPVPGILWWLAALALILTALIMLPLHWQALTDRGLEGFLDLQNLGLIALVYPVVKALHELGHGLAVRTRGGQVREMGLMFIAFYPLPYVEASASLTFRSKWDRAAVAAAGVVVELTIAALAFMIWVQVEPGTFRTILYNIMIVSGLSTLVVNGNPLMKFDGYHALCDVIEIPNLGTRGNQWWGEQLRRRVLGTQEPRHMHTPVTGWERLWFLFYPPAAFIWRIGVTMSIALFVATTYRAVGVVLALWSVTLALIWPAIRTARQALTDPRIRAVARRASLRAGLVTAVLIAALGLTPLPHYAVVEGVTWLPEDAFLRAADTGRVVRVAALSDTVLPQGAEVLTLDAPDRAAELRIARAREDRLSAEYAAALLTDRAQAAELQSRRDQATRERQEAESRVAALDIRTALPGRLVLTPDTRDPEGRVLSRGMLIGHVLPAEATPVIRAVVGSALSQDLRDGVRGIELRYADDLGTSIPGHILREVPAVADRLPSPALSLDGGGRFATVGDPNQPLRTVDRLVQLDIAPDGPGLRHDAYGLRVLIRMEFAPKPVAQRAWRGLRRLFLDTFDV